jgi:hypothetical protein
MSSVENQTPEKNDPSEESESSQVENITQPASPVLDFLSTTNGSQIATQMISAFQSLQQEGGKTQLAINKFEKLITCVLVVVIITAVTALTYFDKFTPSIGVLFGSLVGYIYGKKS